MLRYSLCHGSGDFKWKMKYLNHFNMKSDNHKNLKISSYKKIHSHFVVWLYLRQESNRKRPLNCRDWSPARREKLQCFEYSDANYCNVFIAFWSDCICNSSNERFGPAICLNLDYCGLSPLPPLPFKKVLIPKYENYLEKNIFYSR